MTLPLAGEVHVWHSLEGAGVDADWALLDATETERARRFRFDRDRSRYVSHHAFVRRVLARYLGVDPAAVVMRSMARGKPELEPDVHLAFNASRSHGLSVVAVSGGRVGIDVERARPIEDALRLARSQFSPRERTLLDSLPEAQRDDAFLAIWTRKEAVVKAFGLGLSVPLDSFDVCGAHALDRPWQGMMGSEPFAVTRVEVPSGWIAAVSASGSELWIRTGSSLVPA
jgi:4'-phosphopantetheinyl transferase